MLTVISNEANSHEEAAVMAEAMRNCPYLVACGVTGSRITNVFMVPEEKRWWADYSELFPEANAQTILAEEVHYPSKPREIIHSEEPPCGAICSECPQREQHNCKGCAATLEGKTE